MSMYGCGVFLGLVVVRTPAGWMELLLLINDSEPGLYRRLPLACDGGVL